LARHPFGMKLSRVLSFSTYSRFTVHLKPFAFVVHWTLQLKVKLFEKAKHNRSRSRTIVQIVQFYRLLMDVTSNKVSLTVKATWAYNSICTRNEGQKQFEINPKPVISNCLHSRAPTLCISRCCRQNLHDRCARANFRNV